LRHLAIVIVAAATLTGCYIPGQTTTAPPDQAAADKADQALKELENKVLSKGPNGETPSPAAAADLTPEQVDKIKGMKAKAAIVMHYAGNDWATAQIAGLKSEFGNLGIEVVAVTDANFKPDKQVSDLETVMSKKPNIIVSIPTDPVATATGVQSGGGRRGEARVHGQRAQGIQSRHGLRVVRLSGQLRQRRRLCPSDG
jgi:ribose transport system substrate-binding protein